MRIAVEGCLHGELDAVYSLLLERERREGVKVDLLLCCGDFQAVRNPDDLQWMKVPDKYKTMGSFYKYYSGEKVAPFLTVFIGGNHEASNHLLELGYGGWVAPNIYYLGYSGVVWFGGLRIGGVSGIFSPHHYHLGHCERLPFQYNMITSAYHVRSFEVFRLKQLTGDIDIFMSHDWPREIYHHGNLEQLLRFKPYFRSEAMSNTLGSPAAKELLDHLQPHKWWAGHLHCRFEASYVHGLTKDGTVMPAKGKSPVEGFPMGKGIWGNSTISTAPMRHPPMGWPQMGQPPMGGPGMGNPPMDQTSSIGHPPKVTEFLALDKCLPKRKCLEVFDFPDSPHPKVLTYDPEWLAITKATNDIMPLNRLPWTPPTEADDRSNFQPTEEELKWIHERFKGDFVIPNNFEVTAPPLRDSYPWQRGSSPVADNPQTTNFCAKLDIVNRFSCDQKTVAFGRGSRYFSHCSSAAAPPSSTYAPPSRTYAPPSSTYAPPSSTYAPPSSTASNPDEIDLSDDDDDLAEPPAGPPPAPDVRPCGPTGNPDEAERSEDEADADQTLSNAMPTSPDRANSDQVHISSLSKNSGSEWKREGDEEEDEDEEDEEEEVVVVDEEEEEEEKEEKRAVEKTEEEGMVVVDEEEGEEKVVVVVEEKTEEEKVLMVKEEGSTAGALDATIDVQGKERGLGEVWSSPPETTAVGMSPDPSPQSSEAGNEDGTVDPPAKRAR